MFSFNPVETRTAVSLSLVFFVRMTGLFVMLPVLPLLATELDAATPLLIGLALGIYGLFQALLQLPFGWLSDRYGRKPIIVVGLTAFVVGCLVAAAADSIWGVIVGRAMQGMGAVSAVVMALAADLCREQMRTRMMALLGASIGLSFILSIILGPLLAGWLSLSGIFLIIALLGSGALALFWFLVPKPEQQQSDSDLQLNRGLITGMVRDRQLLRLDGGIFCLHLLITGSFVVIPHRIVDAGFALPSHWSVYLVAVLASLLIVFPLVGFGERKLGVRSSLLISIVGLSLSLILLSLSAASKLYLILSLAILLGFVSVLEALLPSLVSRIAPAVARGTAMGIYSTSQFLGAFAGGLLGGWLQQHFASDTTLLLLCAVCAGWFLLALGTREVAGLSRMRLPVPALGSQQSSALTQQLRALDGVVEASVEPQKTIAYLKIDKKHFDKTQAELAIAAFPPAS